MCFLRLHLWKQKCWKPWERQPTNPFHFGVILVIASSGSVAYTGTLNAPTLSAGLAWQVSVGSSTFIGAGYGGQSLFLNVVVVPAPGAAALIGLAGLVAGRRRRN